MGRTWLPSYDLLVGTKPDHDLAADLGFALNKVTTRRVKLGILPWRPVVPVLSTASPAPPSPRPRRQRRRPPRTYAVSIVTPCAHLIGTMSDEALAAQIGCSRQTVNAYRKAHKIPRLSTNAQERVIPMLGTAPDSTIAKQLNAPIAMVARLRKARGIPVFARPPVRKSLPGVLEAAHRLEQNASDNRPGFSIPELADTLNRDRKQFISAFYKWYAVGCFEKIGQYGTEDGRNSEYRWRTTGKELPPRVAQFDISILGTMSDHAVARTLGNVSVSRVWHVRKALGIPSWQRQTKRNKTKEAPE
jgi:hypothetical protein